MSLSIVQDDVDKVSTRTRGIKLRPSSASLPIDTKFYGHTQLSLTPETAASAE
jgi:hypothetical protein